MSVESEYLTLLQPKWRAALRRASSVRARIGRFLLVGALGALAWPVVYLTLARFLTALREVEDIGPLLSFRLLALGLLLFFGLLLLSNVIGALSGFFLARDLPALRTAPVDGLSLYLARLTETLISSSWMVLLILVPVLAAYARVFEAGVAFLPISLGALMPFLVIPAVVGSALTLLLVRVFPARRSRDILLVAGLGGLAVLVLVLRVLRPERLTNPESYRNLVGFLDSLRGPYSPWLPSQWTADVLVDGLEGRGDPLTWLLLWSTATGLTTLGAALHGRLYPNCFTRAQEGDEQRIRRSWQRAGLETLLSGVSVRRRELILKDVRTFFRDTTQWSQLIILAVLVVVYVYNMGALPLQAGGTVSRYLTTVVLFLNLALTGFVIAAIAGRFVFPAFSLEGRTLWLLRSSPVETGEILRSKYWTGLLPLTFLALLLTVLTNLVLEVPPVLFVLSIVSIVALAASFTAQALAWGVFFPVFESENAAQIPTSIGGLLYMLGALGSLGLVVLCQGWALRGYFMSGLPGRAPRPVAPSEAAVALALTVGVTMISALFALRAAEARIALERSS
jgi:ABC-2 type transport system permease protein